MPKITSKGWLPHPWVCAGCWLMVGRRFMMIRRQEES
jgi:hypothetical protein